MKKLIFTAFLILFATTTFGQSIKPAAKANVFANFNEFKQNTPSLIFRFKLIKRTSGNIFMTGGISNYKLEYIENMEDMDKLDKEVWGVKYGDSIYINSYPYSRIKGYNVIIEKGYYTYFIGEPAVREKEQRELGIIKPTERKIAVCCQAAYVILPDGTVKLLSPELLQDLCKDNEPLTKEINDANFEPKDVYKMFDFLRRYNAAKK